MSGNNVENSFILALMCAGLLLLRAPFCPCVRWAATVACFVSRFASKLSAGRSARDETLKKAEHISVSRDPFSKDATALDIPYSGTYTPVFHKPLDLNAPLAHQPHYYRQLPSVRNPVRNRNVFLPLIEPRPPLQGYLPHPGYSNTHLTLGVPPVVSRGRGAGASPGVPNVFPSGPYDATQPVDERGAVFRMRGAQQDLKRIMMGEATDRGGARIVGKRYALLYFPFLVHLGGKPLHKQKCTEV